MFHREDQGLTALREFLICSLALISSATTELDVDPDVPYKKWCYFLQFIDRKEEWQIMDVFYFIVGLPLPFAQKVGVQHLRNGTYRTRLFLEPKRQLVCIGPFFLNRKKKSDIYSNLLRWKTSTYRKMGNRRWLIRTQDHVESGQLTRGKEKEGKGQLYEFPTCIRPPVGQIFNCFKILPEITNNLCSWFSFGKLRDLN